MKKKVGVLMGGMGAEKEVSQRSGAAFVKSLERLQYPFEVIQVEKDLPKVLSDSKIDCALIALHGKYGEDGTVQGILEYLKIPYTGSGVLSSSLSMNKAVTKQILTHWSIPTPPSQSVDLSKTKAKDFKLKLEFPVVVKPSREGSTVGLSIVRKDDELQSALELASKSDNQIVIEKYIDGTEITVPIWIDRALPIIEIVPKSGFYDYKSKYTAGETEYIIPARISENVRKICENYSLETFKVMDCRQYARVDIRLDKNDKPYVLEVNTLPGFTETSLFPKSALKAGISFDSIIETLVDRATLDYR
jgi:D-alanine-D-alanine ligase